jgi:hypothetical protein
MGTRSFVGKLILVLTLGTSVRAWPGDASTALIPLDASLVPYSDISKFVDDALKKCERVKINGETKYVFEGDLLLTKTQLTQFVALQYEIRELRLAASASLEGGDSPPINLEMQPLDREKTRSPHLRDLLQAIVQKRGDGKIDQWPRGTVLGYCVLARSFKKKQGNYRSVVQLIERAASDWERVCGIRFEHLSSLDNLEFDKATGQPPKAPGLVFTVSEDKPCSLLAHAFFPSESANWANCRLWVNRASFNVLSDSAKVGIIRHELGHILGLLHENASSGAPEGCRDYPLLKFEQLAPITYDAQSVMRMFCGDTVAGDFIRNISSYDGAAACTLYGPCSGIESVGTSGKEWK